LHGGRQAVIALNHACVTVATVSAHAASRIMRAPRAEGGLPVQRFHSTRPGVAVISALFITLFLVPGRADDRRDDDRQDVFSTPFTLGRHRLRQAVQTEPLCLGVNGPVPCVENRRWTVGGVTYATLNVQGSRPREDD
jgi:hypothetical protein